MTMENFNKNIKLSLKVIMISLNSGLSDNESIGSIKALPEQRIPLIEFSY